MKVLHTITWLNPGGIEMWLLTMLQQIPRDTCAMDFCCKGPDVGALASTATQAGADVLHCRLTPGHRSFIRRFRAILRQNQYDVIHNHFESYSGIVVWLARQAGIPVISSFHNTHLSSQTWTRYPLVRQLRDMYGHFSIRYALQHSDYITGCSAEVLASIMPNQPRTDRHLVLPYGIRIPPLASAEERAAWRQGLGWPDDTPLVLHVGRFSEQKNHIGLLNVFQRVLADVPAARLLLVGDGPLRPMVEEEVQNRRLADSVRFLGIRDDVSTIMTRCDIFLFPSFFEGFGLAALEANAAGLPVVGSDVLGRAGAVQDQTTALLHDPADEQAMTASVIDLLRDPARAHQLGAAGRTRAIEQFSVANSADQLVALYAHCLGAPVTRA